MTRATLNFTTIREGPLSFRIHRFAFHGLLESSLRVWGIQRPRPARFPEPRISGGWMREALLPFVDLIVMGY